MSYSSDVLALTPSLYVKLDEHPAYALDATGGSPWSYGGSVTVNQATGIGDGGTCASGNGSNPIATLGSVPSGLSGANVTMAAWVYLPTGNLKGSFVKIGSSSNGWGMGIGGTQWDNVGRKLIMLSETVAWHPTAYTFPNTAGWYHVVAVRGTSGAYTCYVNGTSVATGTLTSPVAASGQMGVGGYTEGIGFKLSSTVKVDNVALFASALASGRVTAQYNSGSADNAAVLADTPTVFLKLDEATAVGDSGTTAADSSGNGRNMTHTVVDFGQPSLLGDGSGYSAGYNGSTSYSARAWAAWMDTNFASGVIRINVTSATLSGQQFIASRWGGGAGTNAWLWSVNGGKAEITVFVAGANRTVTGATTLTTGAHTLGWSYNGTTLKVYVDGVADGSLSISGTLSSSTAVALELARAAFAVYGAVKLDEFAYFPGALSDAGHATLHASAIAVGGGVTGTVTGTLPALTASATGDVSLPPITGTVAGTLPALTGSVDGTHTSNDQVGTVAGTLPALSASATGTVLPPPVTGTVAGALPALTGDVAGLVPIVGIVDGTLPALTGYASDGGGDRTGTIAGTLPALGGEVIGYVPTTTLDPWTADVDGRTGLTLLTPDVELTYTPALELPPIGIHERVIQRVSRTVPALHTISGVRPDPVTGAPVVPAPVWNDLPVVTEDLGTIHTTISAGTSGMNEDVTYYRGGITHIVEDTMEEPFGDKSATFRFPQITSLDEEPTGPTHPLWWQTNRANIKIVLKRPDGTKEVLWSGLMVSDDTGNEGGSPVKSRDAIGALWQASYDVRQVPNYLQPTDTGTLIAKALNDVASRNYPAIQPVATGIPSRDRGSWAQSALAYVQGLLGKATDDDGRQWTVAKVPNTRWTYVIRKKSTTPAWTVTNGAHGVKVSLSRDITQGRNVIYGRGVSPTGYAWLNTKYPGMTLDDAPLFPGVLMGLGATDSGSNGGVTLWQQRARELGYIIDIDGTISAGDVASVRTIQRRYGVSVDGIVGPQTWAAMFGVGSNVGSLATVRLPLAADPATQKWLYNADGSRAGLNPAYDPDVMVVSDDVNFDAGTTLAEGIRSAQQIVEREATPSLSGTIELTTDPREGSRLLIPAGDKIKLVGYEHHDRVLHIARRTRSWDRPDLPVTLEVDERSRDALTVAEIRAARRESMRDPARRPGNSNRRSTNDVDQVVPFDGESRAGIIPKLALYGGLWSVSHIPVSETGRVAKMRFKAGAPYAIVLFGAPITPAHLVSYVGNPLASDSPFKAHEKELDAHGFIDGFGQKGQRCGYYPGAEDQNDPFTGIEEQGGFEYSSSKPPWIWVAMYAASSCFIEGRIYPAPVI